MEQSAKQNGGCGLASLLTLVLMFTCGIVGLRIGLRWGGWGSVIGAVLGAFLAIPITGVLLMFLMSLGLVFDRLMKGRQ